MKTNTHIPAIAVIKNQIDSHKRFINKQIKLIDRYKSVGILESEHPIKHAINTIRIADNEIKDLQFSIDHLSQFTHIK